MQAYGKSHRLIIGIQESGDGIQNKGDNSHKATKRTKKYKFFMFLIFSLCVSVSLCEKRFLCELMGMLGALSAALMTRMHGGCGTTRHGTIMGAGSRGAKRSYFF